MAEILLSRRRQRTLADAERAALVEYLLGDWAGVDDKADRAWRGFWRRMERAELGAVVRVQAEMPRLGWFHRMHMKMLQAVFDAQEQFDSFDAFRYWTVVGIGHCDFAPGIDGQLIPVPRSISYASLDQAQFFEIHHQVMEFLRGCRAASYLWPHLSPDARDLAVDALLSPYQQEPPSR